MTVLLLSSLILSADSSVRRRWPGATAVAVNSSKTLRRYQATTIRAVAKFASHPLCWGPGVNQLCRNCIDLRQGALTAMMLSYAPVIIWVLRQYFTFVMCTGISIDLRALYVMTFSLVDVVTCSTFSGSDLELLISN